MNVTLTFGNEGWRIESEPIGNKSNLKLYAEGKLIYEGTYGELVSRIRKQ